MRFFEDQLAVYAAGQPDPVLGFRYGQLQEVEIGGPVSTWSPARQAVLTAAFGTMGALVAAQDAKFQTVIRVQAPDNELFFLHTKSHPDDLRIQLSPALGRIRHAQAASKQVSIADELARLAAMVDRGILTREEFNQLKARLIAG